MNSSWVRIGWHRSERDLGGEGLSICRPRMRHADLGGDLWGKSPVVQGWKRPAGGNVSLYQDCGCTLDVGVVCGMLEFGLLKEELWTNT